MKILVAVTRVIAYNVKVRVKGDGSGVETNSGAGRDKTRGPSALRPEEAYVAEMLAFEETKRRHEELRAEVRRAEAEVRRFRDEQLARLANREIVDGATVSGDAGKSGEPDPSRPDVPKPSTNVLPGVPIARAD